MTSERRQQVEKIIENVVGLPEEKRIDFLDEVCQSDPELREEVESLLSRRKEAAIRMAAALPQEAASPSVRDLVGQRIQSYQVLQKIGAGGMGIVYLAEDTRLGRRVALKTLTPSVAKDQARLRRFLREARAAAAIKHPNVITIFEVGEVDGAPFIVTEFVEGQNLNSKIQGKPFPGPEIIEIALQIAEALATAHDSGIIHRDVKPANIMITTQGQVKVLDFGLAVVTSDSPAALTADGQTDIGLVMGTVQYMSPEQALAKEVDARSDIFSLGLVLYEMTTGRSPFYGQNIVETLDHIIHHEPESIHASNSTVPHEMERIILKCLEKEKDRRYQNARDLIVDLRNLKRDTETGRAPFVEARRTGRARLWKAVISLGVLALVIAVAIFWLQLFQKKPAPSSPRMTFTRLTFQSGQETFPSISPEGKSLVYAAGGDIFLQRVGGRTSFNLTADSPEFESEPAFSPDGESIAFRSERGGGGIFVMEATGENVRRIADFGFNPSWSPDAAGILVATENVNEGGSRTTSDSRIWSVHVAGMTKRLISTVGDAVQPSWSPQGKRIAYWGSKQGQRDLWTVSVEGGDPQQLTNDPYTDWNPVWSPDGYYLYFASDRSGAMNLWRIRMNEETGRASGSPEPLSTPSVYSRDISISRDGRHILYTQVHQLEEIMITGFDPLRKIVLGEPRQVIESSKLAISPEISPSGEWIAFWSGLTGVDKEDIWVVRNDGSGLQQLTHDDFMDRAPRWSPDGKQLAFYSNRSGHYEIWTIQPGGGNLKQLTFFSDPVCAYPAWSPDGEKMSFYASGKTTYIMDLTVPWKRESLLEMQPLENPRRRFVGWRWSQDGEKLAGWLEDDQGRNAGIAIYSIKTGNYETLDIPGAWEFWLRDNRTLIYPAGSDLMLIDTVSKRKQIIMSIPQKQMGQCSASSDERTICCGVESIESDVWMIQMQ